MNIYVGALIAAVIVWDILYQYHMHGRLDSLSRELMRKTNNLDHQDLNRYVNDLRDRQTTMCAKIHAMEEDLKDVRETERRKQLSQQYKDMSARYAKLSKEYSK
jgi:paraquat-inducible protein B